MNNPRVRNIFVYALILLAIVAILWSVRSQTQQAKPLTLGELAQALKRGEVEKISVSGEEITVTRADDTVAVARKEPSSTAAEQLALMIGASEQPEVIFFMQAFAPSCGLTLDGLMKTN